MIIKQFIRSQMVWKVTFEVPLAELPQSLEVERVAVVGEFNGWDAVATPMHLDEDQHYRAEVDLEPGAECQFRYIANHKTYFNDWKADAYVTNSFGTENCVVVTGQGSPADEEE